MKSVALTSLVGAALAATRELNWTVSWTTANPDGLYDRKVVGINDEWPLPVVRVDKDDRLVVRVKNNLTDPYRNSSIHWHGLFQNGTNDMDGPTWLSQCPGAPETEFVYNFTIGENNGTYWYHTHVDSLYPDGYRQILLVDNDKPWFEEYVDEEIFFTVSDWYHDLIEVIDEASFLTLYNPTGAEPLPKSLLMNDTLAENIRYKLEPNKTYRMRIASTAAFSNFYLYFPNHNVTIVEVDGVYTEPAEAESIFITVSQRYSILFNTSSNPDEVFKMVQVTDQSLYDFIPDDLQLNHTAFFYTGNPSEDQFKAVTNEEIYHSGLVDTSSVSLSDFTSDDISWFDDINLVPYDHMELLPDPDHEITLEVETGILNNGIPYMFFNNITWTHPKIPTLYSVMDVPSDEDSLNSTVYGTNTHPYVLDHMDVVQLIINNDDSGKHPFHLHGHNFQCLRRGPEQDTDYVPYDPDAKDLPALPQYPIRRDTFFVEPQSYIQLRFVADNPGVWFFHCHIEWHLSQGLAVEFIEAPVQIRQNFKVHPILSSNVETCRLSGLPWQGNAAGNTSDYFNLAGQNVQDKDLPNGFTARGIVALVFSCISAFLGMAFLTWYGLMDTHSAEQHAAERILNEPVTEDVEQEQFESSEAEPEVKYSFWGKAKSTLHI